MKSKNLANVLLKILGLYICLCAIPSFVIGFLYALLPPLGPAAPRWEFSVVHALVPAVSYGIQAGIGILIIVKSRKIAEFWFKNEEE
jgi:hypothetical protein